MVPPPEPPASPPPTSRRLGTVVLVGLGVLIVAGALAVPALFDDGRRRLPGFGEGTLRVLAVTPGSDRSPAEHCSLLAATPAQQARGLMTRRDLAGYASMVFLYPEEVTVLFYNRNVPMALTVAWFDRDGRWLGSKDLEPCPDMEGCPTIAPPAPFRYALEVEKGGLSRLGLGPGSQIAFSEGC